MRAWVGNTDWQWFSHLAQEPPLEEVNFWQPGGRQRFGTLEPGELFLFRLKSPRNAIVGGGVFAYSTLLPLRLAWDTFGSANGARSFEDMRKLIDRYRNRRPQESENYTIGCILLTQPFFLPKDRWIPVPADWSPNIVQGKTYDLEQEPGFSLFRQLREALERDASGIGASMRARDTDERRGDRYGRPTLITPRLGQRSFRILVTDAYDRRCAITGERVLPVLEAAHIRPYAEEGPHRVDNGILLRSDLHTLFDCGYVTVTPDLHLEVSRRIHEEFDNGKAYYALRGQELRPPERPAYRPGREYLSWHNEHVYQG